MNPQIIAMDEIIHSLGDELDPLSEVPVVHDLVEAAVLIHGVVDDVAHIPHIVIGKQKILQRFANIDMMPIDFEPEARFANVPHVDITPGEMPLVLGREMTIIKDPESSIGVSLVIDADRNRKTYKFPMTFGMYDKGNRKGIVSRVFQKETFVPNQYQWIQVANVKLPDSVCYLWLTNSWKVQIPLNNIAPVDRTKRITAHIHVKFEGDLYYGDGKPSRIYIDRVIITN